MTQDFGGRYAKQFLAGWAMMDFNSHMGNTAYLNLAADVHVAFFAEHGGRDLQREFVRRAGEIGLCERRDGGERAADRDQSAQRQSVGLRFASKRREIIH